MAFFLHIYLQFIREVSWAELGVTAVEQKKFLFTIIFNFQHDIETKHEDVEYCLFEIFSPLPFPRSCLSITLT